ncbi:NAD(P)-dependent dehydrogenase (short-subunit alcohol dehydrogenase family) [Sphingobium sp. OAS761]|uniref:SDR family NAD(P)-dependent oxidoreductase n=1 Tax=Sphingobium sp. OAS761 TaxID=2817901 RepID=UPI00209CC966|nr:SDR family NAD(P)-dependent oxidoreductase [Sphingobium sp. OAS761]MCP1470343.1 NAD(P)-dependent dehydrogenase (short-subunit alcohol dehydrogenase family) [Sphingobium sp. OAS761]
MDLQLTGKRALITGSSSGIGAGIAEELAREGALVVVHGRNADRTHAVARAIADAGGRSATAIGDLSTDDGADAVANAAVAAFGGIDILINNAGGRSGGDGASDWMAASVTDWADTYQKNTIATVRMIHRLAPAMKERGWGRLIQFASSAANSPSSAVGHYAASKAAIINLTVSLSKAFANTGVTANTISPGMIATPSVDEWFDQIAAEKGWTGPDAAKRAERWAMANIVHQTVSRVGRVRDIASLTAYLCSPLADFVNGANFRSDGGRSPGIN